VTEPLTEASFKVIIDRINAAQRWWAPWGSNPQPAD
jgi:hypothetical protein